ncbi:glycosyltransferase family 4 protein [Burkholderia pyrrocinia]|uniref:glycosyltransferase family 4 protein n=1 Tax=Burkholderia pyrrocinia TaxID=60550 RepID=UPI0038B5FA83
MTRLYDGLRPTGVDRVGLAYIQRYGAHARAVLSERGFCSILSPADSRATFDLLLSSSKIDRWAIRKIVARACLQSVSRRPANGGILLHTSHNGMEYERYYDTLKRRSIRPVFLIHDLIPLTHAEYCRPGVDVLHRRRINTALRRAAGLIANSDATCDSLSTEAAQSGVMTPPPTVVARLAPGTIQPSRSPAPIDAPYFVMLGTIEPRKNHWFILHVWRRLVEQMGNGAPRLVVIGRRGWECENVVDMLERCEPLRRVVIEESDCSDVRLNAWLQHARALLFPSFVEGYGMPLVEALALGVPVIASDLPVFHEIASNFPTYLDPLDGPGWHASIRAYAQHDSPERSRQIQRIASFRTPTWNEHFEHVDRFLDSLH